MNMNMNRFSAGKRPADPDRLVGYMTIAGLLLVIALSQAGVLVG